ncbi:MAG: carbohydrate kinase family protein [Acidobacteriaceae bacterium]
MTERSIAAGKAEDLDASSASSFDIAIVGELNLDLILYGLPQELPEEHEILASDFAMTLGSSSAILAHNLAILGSRVAFTSRVGTDTLGAICCERLEEAGVDISHVVRAQNGSGTGVTLLLPHGGTRHILTYPGAMFEMGIEDVDVAYLSLARHFHLSSLFLHQKLLPDIPELFSRMKRAGLTTSLDTNDDPEDKWGEILHQVLPLVDVLLCNHREIKKIAGVDNIDSAALRIAEKVPLVIVKCGDQGARAYIGGKQIHKPAIAVSVIDSIGAGDSFNAGFLHQWVRHADLETCLSFGNLTGALSATRPGGTEAFRNAAYRNQFLQTHG